MVTTSIPTYVNIIMALPLKQHVTVYVHSCGVQYKSCVHIFVREVKTVAEQVDDESTEAWVDRMRKAQREKEIAEERVSGWRVHNCVFTCALLSC